MDRSRHFLAAALAASLTIASEPAFAHHVMGGQMPQTFLQGFLSGLGHPVIGLDHFAALAGVGILAALFRRGLPLVLLFSAALIGGVGLHLMRLDIPAAELLVALATVLLGFLIIARRWSIAIAPVLILAAGVVHGYALGESIVGAEQTPLFAYLAGIFVIQSLVSAIALLLTRRLGEAQKARSLPFAGAAIALIGAVFAVQASGILA
jgi:urease accessory protein